MIRLFLTLALLLALPAQATINAASFQRIVFACAESGERKTLYPDGGATCTPVPALDYQRAWNADSLTTSSTAEDIDALTDVSLDKAISAGGFTSAACPWCRTVIASTVESGEQALQIENLSNFLDGAGKRRIEAWYGDGAELATMDKGAEWCVAFPIKFRKGPYSNSQSWTANSSTYLFAQLFGTPSYVSPIVGLRAGLRTGTGGSADEIGIKVDLDEGATDATKTRHYWWYTPGGPAVENGASGRGADLNTVYWITVNWVFDPANDSGGKLRVWIKNPAVDAADSLGTLMTDYTGRVGFGDYTTDTGRFKNGLYFGSAAGVNVSAEYGNLNAHPGSGCESVVQHYIGAAP